MTDDSEIRGTPAFMPFEQFRDSRHAKPTVDIYAAGATLYWLLTGHPPFKRTLLQVGKLDELRDAFLPLPDLRPDLPPQLSAIVHRALALTARERFGSAEEMRSALLSCCKTAP